MPPVALRRHRLRRFPVRGADLVLMAQHARWRRGGASNNTTLVLHCDGPLDPERLRRTIDRFLDLCPWPAARLRRPLPWGRLRWVAGPRATSTPPPVHRRIAATPEHVQRLLEADLNAAIDPGREPPIRFTIIDGGGDRAPGALAVTWFHPLMDPRGGQNLLSHLARLDASDGPPACLESWPTPGASAMARPLRERGRLARRNLDYLRTLAPIPPVSPGGRLVTPGPVRFRRESFVDVRPVAGRGRVGREIWWRLAVVGHAMAQLWRRRGLPDVPFLLPISVDLRPRGEPGPTFGNVLAFHFARFRPSETADVAMLATSLRRQMVEAMREGQIDANAVAMEFLQYRPLSRMLRALPWTTSGEIFSFNCADVAEFPPALQRFLGRRVLNAYHVPCVLPRPGIGVFFNRCAGRHNVVVSWVEGAVTEDETALVLDGIRAGMAWVPAP